MPRKPPDPKRIARRNHEVRVAEEFPLPKVEGSIKELDVLNTGAVILKGVFDLAQLEAIVAHMKALGAPE